MLPYLGLISFSDQNSKSFQSWSVHRQKSPEVVIKQVSFYRLLIIERDNIEIRKKITFKIIKEKERKKEKNEKNEEIMKKQSKDRKRKISDGKTIERRKLNKKMLFLKLFNVQTLSSKFFYWSNSLKNNSFHSFKKM